MKTLPELKSMWARMIRRIEPCYPMIMILTFLLASGPSSLLATGTSDVKPEPPKNVVAATENQYVVLTFAKECISLNEDAKVEVAVKDNGDPDWNKVKITGVHVERSCGQFEVRKKIADGGPIPMCNPNCDCRPKHPNPCTPDKVPPPWFLTGKGQEL